MPIKEYNFNFITRTLITVPGECFWPDYSALQIGLNNRCLASSVIQIRNKRLMKTY